MTCDSTGKRIVSKYSQLTPIGKDVYAALISKSASGKSENDIYSSSGAELVKLNIPNYNNPSLHI